MRGLAGTGTEFPMMRRALAGIALCLALALPGLARADHVDWAELVLDQRPLPTLAEVDACLFGPTGRRDLADMDAACRAMLETCWSRMHLDPADGFPEDPGDARLLVRCSEEQTGRYYVLLLRHSGEITAAFPREEGEDRRTEAINRLVRVPEDAATAAALSCVREGEWAQDRMLVCGAARGLDALIRSRQAWWEERN